VDTHFTQHAPSPEERQAVDSVLGGPDSGWRGGPRNPDQDGHSAVRGHALGAQRHLLLPVLHAIQVRMGWITPAALNYACQRLDIPPADAYGVACFYGLFSVTPRPPRVLHLCDDIACLTRGAGELCAHLEEQLGPPGSPTLQGKATWYRSSCLGLCERAPAALMSMAGERPGEKVFAPASPDTLIKALETFEVGVAKEPPDRFDATVSVPQAGRGEHSSLMLLRRVGRIDPVSIDDYRAHGGYEALRRALSLGGSWLIREVLTSRLFGRGGAAFPSGKKWDPVNLPYYLVCNADESEPGTFKDRVVMEGDPFSLIEAMTIAGYAIGSTRGYLYLRGEYPLAGERLAHAIEAARARGFLGHNILGRGVHFDIEIRRGAGAYICGEETALFNSIEGFRGEPRNKPPFPTQVGLFGRPTVVNNVETLINVLLIVHEGGERYAAIGTHGSACMRFLSARPSVSSSNWAAVYRAAGVCRPCCWGALPELFLRPTNWTPHSPSRARGPSEHPWDRGS